MWIWKEMFILMMIYLVKQFVNIKLATIASTLVVVKEPIHRWLYIYLPSLVCAKVSIVGAGMQSHSGVASKMFEALSNNNINIKMISTSEIKIACIIYRDDADKAVSAIHDMLFD